MQASTANTQHDRGSPVPQVPPELLETVARALVAAFVPPPRQPALPGTEQVPDFLTAAQLAARLGVSRETVRRLAIAGALPHTVVCRGPGRRPAGTRDGSPTISRPAAWTQPTWPSSPLSGGRGWPRPGCDGCRARHRTPALPVPALARWWSRAACRGADLDGSSLAAGESAEPARRVCAGCPVRQPCLDYALSHGITTGSGGPDRTGPAIAARSSHRRCPAGT